MGLPKMKYYRGLIADILACTLIVLAFILLLTKACGAQVYGFNGTNVPENLTPEVRQWVIDMHPEGDTVVMVFRNDKYTTAAPLSDLENVIFLSEEMTAQNRVFELIYTFNTRGVSLENNFFGLDYFIENGVRIRAVRLGNEEYFKAAGHKDWNTYWSIASPIKTAVYSYNYPILIPVADHLDTKWNPSAAQEINSDPLLQPDFHFYWGRNDLEIYRDTNYVKNESLIKRPNSVGYDDFYSNVYFDIVGSTLLEETMTWFYDTFPTKKLYITEYGAGGNPGGMGGTLGFEAANDWFLNQISGYMNVDAVCKFNGASITGYITPTGKLDLITEPYIKRLSYYTLKNFYFNRGKEWVHNFTLDTLEIQKQGYTGTFTGISGGWSSSSGACAWWASNSVKKHEIAGVQTYSVIPPMSYGYLTYEPIKGCTNPEATNYNPDAIQDDGSCILPVKCYRKRWLFSSLGCKEAKTKCNCI